MQLQRKSIFFCLLASFICTNICLAQQANQITDKQKNILKLQSQHGLPIQIPNTVRTISCFKKIEPHMSIADVISMCGLPDADIGNGIFVYEYQLTDGSTVYIGSIDSKTIHYVAHEKNYTKIMLLHK